MLFPLLNKMLKLALFIGLLFLCSATFAKQEFQCPPKIQLNSATLTGSREVAPYAVSVSKTPQWLSGINIFDGHPEQEGALKPLHSKQTGNTETSTWNLDASFPDGKWVSCDYSAGAVRLVARIEDTAKLCRAAVNTKHKPNKLEISLSCE